jgi:S-methylmethionine-dependent homocysteine/selenocysteine methylase
MHSPPVVILPALAAARRSWHGVLGAYPEITTQLAEGGAEAVPDEDWITLCASWRDAGAQILGGCCGTTPEHIRSLRQRGSWL